MSHTSNITSSHKANPVHSNTSEAKQHSKEVLNNEFNGNDIESPSSEQGKSPEKGCEFRFQAIQGIAADSSKQCQRPQGFYA